MSSNWSPTASVDLQVSRYTRRLHWVAGLSLLPVVWLVSWPWWGRCLLALAIIVLLRGWRLPQIRQLQLRDNVLTVVAGEVQTMEKPGRVLRLGPWLALQTPKGWLHLFDDQAPRAQLQPVYQWLWVNRVR